ncbi:hypothetical protein BDA99DRAFT_535474 [Phascolomyces articulosus]|uniref:Uncharacterized protein n=1 Tax=Phascolomyces articulosus TaxID=60185 RepID=A0AAD5PFP8_9FUNG|nr:hypothetical protein BDA99DRAFT_535474 [Phascolomyces articulosus]
MKYQALIYLEEIKVRIYEASLDYLNHGRKKKYFKSWYVLLNENFFYRPNFTLMLLSRAIVMQKCFENMLNWHCAVSFNPRGIIANIIKPYGNQYTIVRRYYLKFLIHEVKCGLNNAETFVYVEAITSPSGKASLVVEYAQLRSQTPHFQSIVLTSLLLRCIRLLSSVNSKVYPYRYFSLMLIKLTTLLITR